MVYMVAHVAYVNLFGGPICIPLLSAVYHPVPVLAIGEGSRWQALHLSEHCSVGARDRLMGSCFVRALCFASQNVTSLASVHIKSCRMHLNSHLPLVWYPSNPVGSVVFTSSVLLAFLTIGITSPVSRLWPLRWNMWYILPAPTAWGESSQRRRVVCEWEKGC